MGVAEPFDPTKHEDRFFDAADRAAKLVVEVNPDFVVSPSVGDVSVGVAEDFVGTNGLDPWVVVVVLCAAGVENPSLRISCKVSVAML